jgi:hypothetical protein
MTTAGTMNRHQRQQFDFLLQTERLGAPAPGSLALPATTGRPRMAVPDSGHNRVMLWQRGGG